MAIGMPGTLVQSRLWWPRTDFGSCQDGSYSLTSLSLSSRAGGEQLVPDAGRPETPTSNVQQQPVIASGLEVAILRLRLLSRCTKLVQ
jgi:hypothetical protein